MRKKQRAPRKPEREQTAGSERRATHLLAEDVVAVLERAGIVRGRKQRRGPVAAQRAQREAQPLRPFLPNRGELLLRGLDRLGVPQHRLVRAAARQRDRSQRGVGFHRAPPSPSLAGAADALLLALVQGGFEGRLGILSPAEQLAGASLAEPDLLQLVLLGCVGLALRHGEQLQHLVVQAQPAPNPLLASAVSSGTRSIGGKASREGSYARCGWPMRRSMLP